LVDHRQKRVSRILVGTVVLGIFLVLLSRQMPVNVVLNVISTFDGSEVHASVEIIEDDVVSSVMETNSTIDFETLPKQLTFVVGAEGFNKSTSQVWINTDFEQEITISLKPIGMLWGYVRHAASNSPLESIEVLLFKDGATERYPTDERGIYVFYVSGGKYQLNIDNDTFHSIRKALFIEPGSEFIQSLSLMPKDVKTVSFSDYSSYSCNGWRKGKIAYYPQALDVIIKKNTDGKASIYQSYDSSWQKGKSLIVVDRFDAWIAEGINAVPEKFVKQSKEFAIASNMLIKTNEELLDHINWLRFADYAQVTNLGEETVNNTLCDKIHVFVNDPGSPIGWVDFDVNLWVMKEGKLIGMPTRVAGKTRGRDEAGHYFELNLDLSVTDVGNTFDIGIPTDSVE